jgi:hypothetical protein
VQFQFVQQRTRARKAVGRRQGDPQPFRQTRSQFHFSRRHKSILPQIEHGLNTENDPSREEHKVGEGKLSLRSFAAFARHNFVFNPCFICG